MNRQATAHLPRQLALELGVMGLAALVAALIGPFGTYALPFSARLTIWLIFALGGYAFFRPVVAGAGALAAQTGLARWAALALACALAALPTTLLVAWTTAGMAWQSTTIAELARLYPKVLLLGAVVTAIQYVARPERKPAEALEPIPEPLPATDETGKPPPPVVPSFIEKLPRSLGHDLLYLSNEDHYVRAHTPLGDTLILMRMRDAVAELAPLDGARVHRSWWVARRAVEGVVRRGRTVTLRLIDGREVPVSRDRVSELRERDWL